MVEDQVLTFAQPAARRNGVIDATISSNGKPFTGLGGRPPGR